jgi:hypothetical protein
MHPIHSLIHSLKILSVSFDESKVYFFVKKTLSVISVVILAYGIQEIKSG